MAPQLPHTAAAFLDDGIAVVDLAKTRNRFSVSGSAVTRLPEGLLKPGFNTTNISDQGELLAAFRQTAEAAGLGNKKRWSIALPEGAARSLVVGLESKPASRRELEEILAWKIERSLAVAASELRISRQSLASSGGKQNYLVTAARREVMAEYDSLFEQLGWYAGLMLPKHLVEAQWLMWDSAPGDKILVSGNATGFTALIAQKRQLTLIRSLECEPEAILDELYRIAIYYQDHMLESASTETGLNSALILGDIDRNAAADVIRESTGREPRLIEPFQFGLDFSGEPVGFNQLAAAGGIASMAWR